MIFIFDNMYPKPNGKKISKQTKKKRISRKSKAMGLHPKGPGSKKALPKQGPKEKECA